MQQWCERERGTGRVSAESEREKEMEVFLGLAITILTFRPFRGFFPLFYLFILNGC
jgi:hypothetical protein